MSKFLAIDTSSRYLTVVAQGAEKRVVRHIADCATQHSVILMGEVEAALNEASLNPADCDFFAAVTGPGSFTGIRIGISTVKGLAAGAGKPVLGVTSFDMLAYNVKDGDFCICIDAAHSHCYVKGYGKYASPPAYLTFDEIRELNCPLYGFEELPFENYTKLNVKDCLHPAVCLSEGNIGGELTALYVRKSQAEESRDAKSGKK